MKGVISSCHLQRVCLSWGFLPLCPLKATLTAPSSSPTANCSKLTRSLFSFRDTGKWNFLADVSKSSMPFGIVIWSLGWGGVEGVWFQHWVRDSSRGKKVPESSEPGWKALRCFCFRESGIKWNELPWEVVTSLSIEVSKWRWIAMSPITSALQWLETIIFVYFFA